MWADFCSFNSLLSALPFILFNSKSVSMIVMLCLCYVCWWWQIQNLYYLTSPQSAASSTKLTNASSWSAIQTSFPRRWRKKIDVRPHSLDQNWTVMQRGARGGRKRLPSSRTVYLAQANGGYEEWCSRCILDFKPWPQISSVY